MSVKNLDERSVIAAKRFLERKGLEIIDANSESEIYDFVCVDKQEKVLSFIKTAYHDNPEEGFKKIERNREVFEKDSCKWLTKNNNYLDYAVSYDEVSIIVIDNSRAFLRYHTNILEIEG